MHFDNYLQTKSTQPSQFTYNKFHYPSTQNNTQSNSFRQTTTNHHLPFNKTSFSFIQARQEYSKTSIPNNFIQNDIKNTNLEHKHMNPISSQINSEVTANHSYISLASNYQKVQESKKFITLSPAKQIGRATTGIPSQTVSKIQQRRSESINDPRIKNTSQNKNPPWSRQSAGIGISAKNTSQTSPFQLNFSNNPAFPGKIQSFVDRKSSIQKLNFFKGNDNQWSRNSSLLNINRESHNDQTKLEKSFLNFQKQKKINQLNTDSTWSQNEDLSKQSSINQTNNEDLSKDITVRNLSFIQKDIQKLKNASKRVEEVYQNQISKNYYFNKFLEQKGIKPLEQEKKLEIKENKDSKQIQKRIYCLDYQLLQKQKQVKEKDLELLDQMKTIIDKNKVIDSLSIQLKQYKLKMENKQIQLNDKQEQILKLRVKYQQLVELRKCEQVRMAQNKKKEETGNEVLQKVRKENKTLKLQIQKLYQTNKKMVFQIKMNQQVVSELLEKNQKQLFELDRIKQLINKKQSQLAISQINQQTWKQKVKEQQNIIQELKKQQFRYTENISSEQIISNQQLDNNLQCNNYEQQIIKLTSKINELQIFFNQLSILLLNEQVYSHEKIVLKLKELKQSLKIAQDLREKEQQRTQEIHLQRMHQQYLQKKFNELSRQFKRVSGKLGTVSNEVQLGWRLLKETNNEIVLLNLNRLNERYIQNNEQIK